MEAFQRALYAAAALSISHLVCCSAVMYLDLSGKWAEYSLNKKRTVALDDYIHAAKSFLADLVLLFIPVMTFCFYYRSGAIDDCTDSVQLAMIKLGSGFFIGKIWAFVVHYFLHMPSLYRFHRRHHMNPKKVIATGAWEDSFVEYALMEIPSFCITILCFPTHFSVHLLHFAWHGWDGASAHSGFAAPGVLGWLFDGEYHYYHHAYLNINYAELEIIDKLAGTHHSQQPKFRSAFRS